MKKSRINLVPLRLRACLVCLLAASGMALTAPPQGSAQDGAKERQERAQQGTQNRQERPATGSQGSSTKAGGQSQGGGRGGLTTADAKKIEANLREQIDEALKKADNSGASKYPQTSERLAEVKNSAKEFMTKVMTFSDEKLLEQLSGTGEPAGEAKRIINEANDIAVVAAKLSKQPEGGDQDSQQDVAGGGIDWLYWLGWLIWGLVALLAIAALTVFALFLVKLNGRVSDLENLRVKDVQRFKGLEKALGEQKVYAQTVESGVTRLRDDVSREIEELRRSYRDMRTGQRPPSAVTPEPFERAERVPVRDPGPTFPALVSDYLSKVSDSKKVEVEADFRTNLFVPAPGGPFVLVQDDDGTGSGIVLPKSRLQKGQEFVSYYKGTYYCDSPSAGEVFVVEPAVVDHASGGWRLRSPGRLELK